MIKTMWICGRYVSSHDEGNVWDFQGVFSSEELAIQACVTDQYFVGDAVLDEPLPPETQEWPGAYYPLQKGDG